MADAPLSPPPPPETWFADTETSIVSSSGAAARIGLYLCARPPGTHLPPFGYYKYRKQAALSLSKEPS